MPEPMKIYIAADVATPNREDIVEALEDLGHRVYDPVRPHSIEELDAGETAQDGGSWERFSWGSLSGGYVRDLSSREIRDALTDPEVVRSYQGDRAALRWADVVILLLPSPDGCLLAAGLAVGLGKRVYAYMPDGDADVWLSMFDRVLVNEGELASLVPSLAQEQAVAQDVKSRLMDDGDYE
jgi:nucleoside 2-deoxyribosyltransferase